MRSCGKCRLCCKAFPVPAFDKPAGVWCRHACDKGCAIYDQGRPPVCTDFRCLWLDGALSEKMRPDKCGCIFWTITEIEHAGESIPLFGIQQSYPAAWLGRRWSPSSTLLYVGASYLWSSKTTRIAEGFVYSLAAASIPYWNRLPCLRECIQTCHGTN